MKTIIKSCAVIMLLGSLSVGYASSTIELFEVGSGASSLQSAPDDLRELDNG